MTERIGPYRVYERLGVGGMGEVFKAYDDRLDRWVAIKRIRPDRLDAEDNRERFKREARATARLNHPSIVHLYGIFQDEEDADCIVMEFVDGRTLDTFLAEGPLEPNRVARLGHEIASGLAEAHANGILHRDLKAENIMITPRGRAKILDFGLAKPILASELDPVLTSKGQLVGTSRAMSPEYVSGEEVDHRSDLFAMGVLLYECLTGQSPFKAHNTLATLKQVMLHKQTPVVQLNPEVSPELSDLIDRLLSKDPNDRPQNAEEVALAFGRVTGQVSSGIIDTPNFGSGTHPRTGGATSTIAASDTVLDLRPRNRRLAVIGILLVALIGAFFLGRQFVGGGGEDQPKLPADERIRIVLGEFRNSSEEEMLGASLAGAFRAVLEQSRANTVLSQSQLKDTLLRMELPADTAITREVGLEISEREGAERLIVGSVSKFGNNYSLVVDVVDPRGDTTTLSANDSAKGTDELLPTIERLAQSVRRHLGESAAEIEKAIPLERVTTGNLDALKAYTAGESLVALARNNEAIDFFSQAINLDPSFAMAFAKLGVAYANIGKTELAVESFKKALTREDKLSEVQKLYLKGWLARWEGTSEEVIANFGLMAQVYPENYIASYNLGQALWIYRNDFEGAAEALKKAALATRGEEQQLILTQSASCLIALDRYESAANILQGLENPDVTQVRLRLALAKRESEKVEELLTQLDPATPAVFLLNALATASEFRFPEAFETLSGSGERNNPSNARAQRRNLANLATFAFVMKDPLKFAHITDKAIALERDKTDLNNLKLFQFLWRLAIRDSLFDASKIDAQIVAFNNAQRRAPLTLVERAFETAFDAERALANGKHDEAKAISTRASGMLDSVQLMESAAFIAFQTGEEDRASSLRLKIASRPGLGVIECSRECLGEAYSYLLPLLFSTQGQEHLASGWYAGLPSG
ncbi:MAG: protein kinase [Acidobacteriota bacterium]